MVLDGACAFPLAGSPLMRKSTAQLKSFQKSSRSCAKALRRRLRPRLCQKEIDPVGTRQFGLVAEDVEKLNPDLVVHDERGQVNSVRYDQVNAMLLNEFLKEHRKVQEQEALIAQLKKDGQVVVRLKEQDANIQRVNDWIELIPERPAIAAHTTLRSIISLQRTVVRSCLYRDGNTT